MNKNKLIITVRDARTLIDRKFCVNLLTIDINWKCLLFILAVAVSARKHDFVNERILIKLLISNQLCF